MAVTPPYMIGSNVTVITIVGQTVDSNGTMADRTLSEGLSTTLVGQLDEDGIEWNFENDTENIQAMDIRRKNLVVVESGTSITFKEILKKNESSGYANTKNVLAAFMANTDVVKCTLTRSGRTLTLYGCITGYTESLNKRKCIGSLTLGPIDAGSSFSANSNATYA